MGVCGTREGGEEAGIATPLTSIEAGNLERVCDGGGFPSVVGTRMGAGPQPSWASSQRSQSRAAMQPEPAAVIACR